MHSLEEKMKIGIIKEGKTPPDKRVAFTPKQCKAIIAKYPEVDLVVQRSPIRAFNDQEYIDEGIELVDRLDDADVIFGVKEVNLDDLIANKTYFFFSHTIKEQEYNRKLLQIILEKNIQLIDYETLTNEKGIRIVGFGKYAGIVGCYNAFLAYGVRSKTFQLKAAHLCVDRREMEAELPKIILPNNFKIVLTGLGRVAGGAKEILAKMGVKEVDPQAFLTQDFTEAVYTQLSVAEYFKKGNGEAFERVEVYNHPERFESNFFPYAKVADMYISCHFWDSNGPKIFSKEEMQSEAFKIRTIADISCDINDPIPSTIRPSTIASPIYEYDRLELKEVNASTTDTITVMAVDNLPCELPKDASEDFGTELMHKVIPEIIAESSDLLERATIAREGKLTENYSYLTAFVGKDL